jgi:RNA methyltransferase, TrmH family
MSIPGARLVTSLANDTVKAVRALHMRKERAETGLFLAEGLKIVIDALELGHVPRWLMFSREADHPKLVEAARATLQGGGEVIEVSRDILEKVSRRDNPQTVVAVFPQVFRALDEVDPAAAACFVALEQVRDPGNLGTIVRTADAAGCGGVILIGDTVDPFSVEAVRATMGSIFHVPVARLNRGDFAKLTSAWPGAVVGTHLAASEDYRTAGYAPPVLLVMGNEQSGLTPETAALCRALVKIPMAGEADSLNLAVATGVMLFEIRRERLKL